MALAAIHGRHFQSHSPALTMPATATESVEYAYRESRSNTVEYVGNTKESRYSVEDDGQAEDPAWYHAPRESAQPPLPLSVLQKKESQHSTTSTATDSSESPSPSRRPTVEDEEEEEEDVETIDETNDYFPPEPTHRGSPKKVPVHVQVRPTGSTSKLRDVKRLSLERLSDSDSKSQPGDNGDEQTRPMPRPSSGRGFAALSRPSSRSSMDMRGSIDIGGRESMMQYRPSDMLNINDLKTDLVRRDSLAVLADGGEALGLGASRGSIAPASRQSDAELPELLRAAKTGNLKMLKACLQAEATVLLQRDTVHGQTALHIAVRHGQFAAVRVLCQKKFVQQLVDTTDMRGNTPLHLAAARSRRITKFLLEQGGADVTKLNSRGQTPLAVHILTVRRDDPLIAEMLLQHKSDANAPLDKSSLLHKAVELQLFEIACRLVRYGARLDIKDEAGKMVFEKVNRKVLRQLINKISYPPVWVPNDERSHCMLCSRKFSKFYVGVRRHHCRHCGRICCGQCSHVSVESVVFPKTFDDRLKKGSGSRNDEKKRVCKTCSSVFKERQKPREEKKKSDFLAKTFGCEWEELHGQQNGPRSSLMA